MSSGKVLLGVVAGAAAGAALAFNHKRKNFPKGRGFLG